MVQILNVSDFIGIALGQVARGLALVLALILLSLTGIAQTQTVRTPFIDVIADCGAKGDGVTDDGPAIQACLKNNPGRTIMLRKMRNTPAGSYTTKNGAGIDYLSSIRIRISQPGTALDCNSGGEGVDTGNGCVIAFAATATGGLYIDNTCYFCRVRAVGIYYIGLGYANAGNPRTWFPLNTTDGILVTGAATVLDHVTANFWGRHGFYVEGNHILDGGEPDFFECDHCVAIDNQQDGLYMHGGDANQGMTYLFNAYGNLHIGIQDDSQLGNVHIAPHTNSNGEKLTWSASDVHTISRTSNIVTVVSQNSLTNGAPIPGNSVHVAGTAGMATPANGDFIVCKIAGCVVPTSTTFSYQQAGPNERGTNNTGTTRFSFLDEVSAAYWGSTGSGSGYIGAYSGSGAGTWIQPYTEMNQGDGVHGCVNWPNGQTAVIGPHFSCGQGPTSVASEWLAGASRNLTLNNTGTLILKNRVNQPAIFELMPGLTADQPGAIDFVSRNATTTFWSLNTTGGSGGSLQMWDGVNNQVRLELLPGGDTYFNAAGGAGKSIQLNGGNGAGDTVNFWSQGSSIVAKVDGAGRVIVGTLTLANLGSPSNGAIVYCSDCKNVIDDSATAGAACAGPGHGAIARRENGHWACN